MQVIKATKCFRQVSIITSLVFSLTSIVMLCLNDYDCSNSNLRATTAIVFALWSTVFVLLLLQAVNMTQCLKKIPKLLFAFYVAICGSMFFVQLELWGGVPTDPLCREQAPGLYWWLVVNIIVFYIIVSFGLATWGSYLCKVADVQEEVTQQAIKEYLEETKRDDKHFMIKAGVDSQPMLMQNGENAQISAQRLMLTNNQNPYAMQPHSEQVMQQYNGAQMQRQGTQYQQQQQMMLQQQQPVSPMMVQQQQPQMMIAGPGPQPVAMMPQGPVEQLD